MDKRFAGDVFPDNTWGICKLHSPVGIVRLVGDDGKPAPNGVCEMCYQEAHDEKFFACPTHGINPKTSGKVGCPVAGCLGEGVGPTEDEIAREAESIGRVWPGGDAKLQDALAQTPAGPESLSAGGALTGPRDAPDPVPLSDAGRSGEPAGSTTSTPAPRFHHQPQGSPTPQTPESGPGNLWVDPFLTEEEP